MVRGFGAQKGAENNFKSSFLKIEKRFKEIHKEPSFILLSNKVEAW